MIGQQFQSFQRGALGLFVDVKPDSPELGWPFTYTLVLSFSNPDSARKFVETRPSAYISEMAQEAAEKIRERIDKPAVEPLIEALGDPDAGVRERAARTLREIGDAQAVELLIQALGDPDEDVRNLERVAREEPPWGSMAKAAQEAAERIRERTVSG